MNSTSSHRQTIKTPVVSISKSRASRLNKGSVFITPLKLPNRESVFNLKESTPVQEQPEKTKNISEFRESTFVNPQNSAAEPILHLETKNKDSNQNQNSDNLSNNNGENTELKAESPPQNPQKSSIFTFQHIKDKIKQAKRNILISKDNEDSFLSSSAFKSLLNLIELLPSASPLKALPSLLSSSSSSPSSYPSSSSSAWRYFIFHSIKELPFDGVYPVLPGKIKPNMVELLILIKFVRPEELGFYMGRMGGRRTEEEEEERRIEEGKKEGVGKKEEGGGNKEGGVVNKEEIRRENNEKEVRGMKEEEGWGSKVFVVIREEREGVSGTWRREEGKRVVKFEMDHIEIECMEKEIEKMKDEIVIIKGLDRMQEKEGRKAVKIIWEGLVCKRNNVKIWLIIDSEEKDKDFLKLIIRKSTKFWERKGACIKERMTEIYKENLGKNCKAEDINEKKSSKGGNMFFLEPSEFKQFDDKHQEIYNFQSLAEKAEIFGKNLLSFEKNFDKIKFNLSFVYCCLKERSKFESLKPFYCLRSNQINISIDEFKMVVDDIYSYSPFILGDIGLFIENCLNLLCKDKDIQFEPKQTNLLKKNLVENSVNETEKQVTIDVKFFKYVRCFLITKLNC